MCVGNAGTFCLGQSSFVTSGAHPVSVLPLAFTEITLCRSGLQRYLCFHCVPRPVLGDSETGHIAGGKTAKLGLVTGGHATAVCRMLRRTSKPSLSGGRSTLKKDTPEINSLKWDLRGERHFHRGNAFDLRTESKFGTGYRKQTYSQASVIPCAVTFWPKPVFTWSDSPAPKCHWYLPKCRTLKYWSFPVYGSMSPPSFGSSTFWLWRWQ